MDLQLCISLLLNNWCFIVYSCQHQLQFNLEKTSFFSANYCTSPLSILPGLCPASVSPLTSPSWMCSVFLTSLVSNWRCREGIGVHSENKKAPFTKIATEMTERSHRKLHCAFQTGQFHKFNAQTAKLLLPKVWAHFSCHTDLILERQRPREGVTSNHCCTDNLSCTINKEILRKPIPLNCARETQEPRVGELLSLPRVSLEGSIPHTHEVSCKCHPHRRKMAQERPQHCLTTFATAAQSPWEVQRGNHHNCIAKSWLGRQSTKKPNRITAYCLRQREQGLFQGSCRIIPSWQQTST